MKMLGRAMRAIWNGLDAYLTMFFAIAVATASFLGVANSPVVAASTLAIFFLIAINILRNRGFENDHHQSIRRIEENLDQLVASRVKNSAFDTQDEAYAYLIEYLKEHPVKGIKATLIQYSGSTSLRVMRQLLKSGADVTLFVLHEDTATAIGSQEQAERITQRLKTFEGDLGDDFHPDRLHICKYRPPASLSAVSIDGVLLFIGWYTYDPVNRARHKSNWPHDTVEISGHDIAGYLAWKNTPEYDSLMKTFHHIVQRYMDELALPAGEGATASLVVRIE